MAVQMGRGKIIGWQALLLVLGSTWLLAPSLNHVLSYRDTLVSQYETSGQPYALFFRLGDFLAGFLVTWLILHYYRHRLKSIPILLVLVIGIGMMIDPILTTTCKVQSQVCQETLSFSFFLHAIETTITAAAFVILAVYDAWLRKKLVSIIFVIFQFGYGILFATQYASQQHFNTASQFVYQCTAVVWLAWFCRDFLASDAIERPSNRNTTIVRYGMAAWAFINGLLAIVISLAHIHLLGKIRGLYFAGDSAWLAQHGVIIGVVMLYLSRHIVRGEMRARQIFLVIVGIETLKYSVITPDIPLLVLYSVTFCLLFVTADDFKRGVIPMTWQIRVKDLLYMLGALLLATTLALVTLDRDNRVAQIAGRSFDHFSDYALHSDSIHSSHRRSVLLADTATSFLAVSAGTILWILFRPYKTVQSGDQDFERAEVMLKRYSNSSEDYFKLWPRDKRYFWSKSGEGFIAYKIVGPVAFALADPIILASQGTELIQQFVEWTRARRLRSCFLLIQDNSLKLYGELSNLQIGASAIIDTDIFMRDTSIDKWWRWKKNRAIKQGYTYVSSQFPHSVGLMRSLRAVSDDWLASGGHQERGFAMGNFDEEYLQGCTIHYLEDQNHSIVAFANQLPNVRTSKTATIDLLRYKTEAADAMPYLLFRVIEAIQPDFEFFDLGFVPFASTKGSIQSLARTLSAGRFSAKGLEQFKNKFDPVWQPNYLAYDGDIADLALITINLEKAMETE